LKEGENNEERNQKGNTKRGLKKRPHWLEKEIEYLRMSDEEIYHHFMDSPVTDHQTGNGTPFQVIVHESGQVPRLFKQGSKFISQGVALRELRG
jgi:hypothetical protein